MGDFMIIATLRLINHAAKPQTADTSYWSHRATMTRNKAARVHDPKLEERLRRVALEYERLATNPSGDSRPHFHAPLRTNTPSTSIPDQKVAGPK
jgi:hypothetical protein